MTKFKHAPDMPPGGSPTEVPAEGPAPPLPVSEVQETPVDAEDSLNHFAIDALAQAEVLAESGFNDAALTYAVISLAHSALSEREREGVEVARQAILRRRQKRF